MRLNKIILSVISYIVVGSFQIVVWGQTISGKIIDSEQRPIEGATIVLQTVDSIYIDASISNADGIFTLNGQQEKYRLIIQHLLFQYEASNRQWEKCRDYSVTTSGLCLR